MAPDYPSAIVDGYQIGMFVSYTDCGDAWVKAPDGRVAGLVWETAPEAYFTTLIEPDDHRWGTYAVALNLPLTSDAEAEAYLLALLPELQQRWKASPRT
jgi:hypothetical protein